MDSKKRESAPRNSKKDEGTPITYSIASPSGIGVELKKSSKWLKR